MKPTKLKLSQHQQPPPKPRKDSEKMSPSTASPQSPHNVTSPFKSCEDLWASTTQDPQRLILSLNTIEGSQDEIRIKFERIVQFLSAQIARNNEENKRLTEEVVQLSKEVKECGEDIKVIEGILRPGKAGKTREEEASMERNQSRLSSSSASRRMLLSSRSNERAQVKRSSRRLFMGMAKP